MRIFRIVKYLETLLTEAFIKLLEGEFTKMLLIFQLKIIFASAYQNKENNNFTRFFSRELAVCVSQRHVLFEFIYSHILMAHMCHMNTF